MSWIRVACIIGGAMLSAAVGGLAGAKLGSSFEGQLSEDEKKDMKIAEGLLTTVPDVPKIKSS